MSNDAQLPPDSYDDNDAWTDADADADLIETVQGELVDEQYELEDMADPLAQSQADEILKPPAPPIDTSNRVEEVSSQAIRQKSSSRLAIFPLAMGFIGLGALLLIEDRIEGFQVTTGAAAIILLGALVLTYLFRFFVSGRRERGLFFLAIVLIMWGIVMALINLKSDTFTFEEFWPLMIAGIGLALFITFLFERSHQVGLVFPGIILLFASGVSFIVSLGIIGQSVTDAITNYWPLILACIGLTLLPSAIQKRPS